MDPEKRRAIILDAAKKVFAEKGFHNAGVADIIEEAGIARGTFYLYFKSKNGIFTALMEYIVQTINEQLVPIDWEDQDAILDVLRRNIERVQELFVGDPHLLKIIVEQATSLDAESRERMSEMERLLIEWMANLVREAQERGILKPIDANLVAFSFMGSLQRTFKGVIEGGEILPDSSQMAMKILELYMFGLISSEYTEPALANLATLKADQLAGGQATGELLNQDRN